MGWVLDGWLRQSQRRGFESQRRLLRHLVSEVPASTANWLYCTIPAWNFWVDAHSRSRRAKNRGPRRTTIGSQGGPRLRAKADQARGVWGSRRAKIGGLGGLRSGVKAGSGGGPRRTGTTQKLKRGNSVVGAGSDSVCLAAGVLLWRDGLSAGRLTQAIAATWVRIPATAPATFKCRSLAQSIRTRPTHHGISGGSFLAL